MLSLGKRQQGKKSLDIWYTDTNKIHAIFANSLVCNIQKCYLLCTFWFHTMNVTDNAQIY